MQQNKLISIYRKKILVVLLLLFTISLTQAAAPVWIVKPSDYVNSMTVIGKVDKIYAAKADDMIAAFSNGICRGVTKPTFVPELNAYYFYLVAFANDEDPKNLNFQLYQSEKDNVIPLFSILKFENNKSLGSLSSPYFFYSDELNLPIKNVDVSTDTLGNNFICTNVITANGDGDNDNWIVENAGTYDNHKFRIVDANGRVVYESLGYQNDWNGHFKGHLLEKGKYFYKVESMITNKTFNGSILVLY